MKRLWWEDDYIGRALERITDFKKFDPFWKAIEPNCPEVPRRGWPTLMNVVATNSFGRSTLERGWGSDENHN